MTVVAGGAGFAGDRIEPAVALATSGRVDAVCLECLAERTIVAGLRARAVDPEQGFDLRLRRRLEPLLEGVAAGCRVVTNLGSANPAAAARVTAALASEHGLSGLSVAAVIGDDVSGRAGSVQWAREPGDGTWLGMHAYLGSDSIAEALADGAAIVITGRAADAALFAGPVRADLDDAEDALAGAIAVGHLLECSGQVTGGNFEAPGERPPDPATFAALGFPLADVASDGSAEIGLLDGAPGRVDRLTCTLQLLYEVHDPSAYLTPDAIVDLSGVVLQPIGDRRVRVSGARHRGVPPTLKVSGFRAAPGAIADVEIAYAGTGALRRARTAADVLRDRMGRLGLSAERVRVDVVGENAVLGSASRPVRAEPPEARAHVSAACPDPELAQAVEDEVYALTLSGPAGGAGLRSERRPHIEVVDGLIDRAAVPTTLHWERSA